MKTARRSKAKKESPAASREPTFGDVLDEEINQLKGGVFLDAGCGPPDGESEPLPYILRVMCDKFKRLRLDIDKRMKPDIVADICDMTPVKSRSIDALVSLHTLEHLAYHEVQTAIGEFARVLKPQGFALVATPDLQEIAKVIVNGNLEGFLYLSEGGMNIAPIDVVYGHRQSINLGRVKMTHRTGFTSETLGKKMVSNGFSSARCWSGDYSILCIAKK